MKLSGVGVRDMTMLFLPMWGLSAVSLIEMELHSAGRMTPMSKHCSWGFPVITFNQQHQVQISWVFSSKIEEESLHIQSASCFDWFPAGRQVSSKVLIVVVNQCGQANLRCSSFDLSQNNLPYNSHLTTVIIRIRKISPRPNGKANCPSAELDMIGASISIMSLLKKQTNPARISAKTRESIRWWLRSIVGFI